MNKNIYYILALIAMSCYREVEIDFPRQETLPAVNSVFQPDSIFSIKIYKTQHILENGPTDVSDAIVTLYEDDQEIGVLEYDVNSFKSNRVAEIGKEYKVQVEVTDFETVTAKDKLVDYPKITAASYKDSVYIGDEGDLFSQITLEIENLPEPEYFELDMTLEILYPEDIENDENSEYRITGSDLFFDPILNDLIIQNEGLLSYFPKVLVFSDELMNANSHTMRINYRPFTGNIVTDDIDGDIILVMKLRKVSKNYYEYKKTLTQHIEAQFGDIWDGVGQPLPVFNNIQNGYGIFAGYSQVTDTIQKQ